VYVTLDRLERKGYLRSELGQPTNERGGKAKRIFTLDPAGRAALQESLSELQRMTRGLEDALEIGAEPV
jgi:DNA-binding PadR family transcriptional regulator